LYGLLISLLVRFNSLSYREYGQSDSPHSDPIKSQEKCDLIYT